MNYKEYGVVSGLHLATLIESIDKLILQGWQPLGGITLTYGKFNPSGEPSESGKTGIFYAQSVVKL